MLRKDRNTRLLTQSGYEDLQLVSPLEGPEKMALNSELRQRVEKGLELLPPSLKTVVLLRDIQGLSNEEVAEVLQTSVPALKARLHRGRVLLRQYLVDYMKENGPEAYPERDRRFTSEPVPMIA